MKIPKKALKISNKNKIIIGAKQYLWGIAVLLAYGHINAQTFENYQETLADKAFSLSLVAVPGGSFSMGADTSDTSRADDEKPQHDVVVDDFWMGQYEVTWAQYETFVYENFNQPEFTSSETLRNLGIDAVSGATQPYVDMSFNMGKGQSPAVNMTQYAALEFCKWLSAKTGHFYRLPTEAEWEYVCKKGSTDKSELTAVAWYKENAGEKYQETGKKQANQLGIHDLLGNVSEWVLDQYSTEYYATSAKENPLNTPHELYPRVLRGGSWKDTADKLCCTSRQVSQPIWKRRDPQIPKSKWWHTDAPFIGFRIVRPKIKPSPEEIKNYWLEAIVDFGEH